MTRLALKKHILKRDPFAGHKIEKVPVNHRYLTGEQFEKLLNAKLPTYRLCHTRDLFVFSTFTGIGRADLANLTASGFTLPDRKPKRSVISSC